MSAAESSIKYRPDIDGLRAVAVISVMLSHIGFAMFSGGYVGVDVFFVISGYLITSIIYNEIILGKFKFSNFYERRARRILPALYFITLLSFFPAWFLLVPQDFVDFAETVIGTVFFSSNVVLWLQTGYFDQAAELKPLLHTWSLAVEEQYYVFFPILLLAAYKIKKFNILTFIIFLLVQSFLLSNWAAFYKPSANYYLLPTRAWELLIGSTVALLAHPQYEVLNEKIQNNMLSKAAPLTGLLLIIVPIFWFDKTTPFPSFWALFPTLGTAFIILFSQPTSITYRLLGNKLMVGLGLISYSAYLWHQPIFSFMRFQNYLEIDIYSKIGAIALSLIAAFLTWKFVEQPFRSKKTCSARAILIFSLIVTGVLLVVATMVLVNNGVKERFELRPPLSASNFDLAKRSNGWCFYSIDTNESLKVGNEGTSCILGTKNGQKRALLFGDSYAGMYEPLWDRLGKEHSIKINSVTTNWCYPSLTDNFWWPSPTRAYEQCLFNRNYVIEHIKDYDAIIIFAVWTKLEQHNLMDDVLGLIEYAVGKNVAVIIMSQPAMLTRNSVISSSYMNSLPRYGDQEELTIQINSKLSSLAIDKNVFFVERDALFKDPISGGSILTSDGVPYSWDGGHISIYGSHKAAENFLKTEYNKSLYEFIYEQPLFND